ncbi:MAG: nitrilase [Deltaproteobacteria bacterium]|nr:nitrilase [Deltaproteobacteria bacterium]
MDRDVRIGLASIPALLGRPEANLAAMDAAAAEAAALGVEVLCLPELSLPGYALSDELSRLAEPMDGPFATRAAALARAHGLVVLFGMAEQNPGGLPFVAQVAATPDGTVRACRKVHVNPKEAPFISGADSPVLFSLPGFSFGVVLCYDAHFPWLCTSLAVAGADAVFFPHASPRGDSAQKEGSWMRTLPARAFDNGVYTLAVNQAGDNDTGLFFPPLALALDALGRPLAQARHTPGLLVADLSAEALDKVRSHPMRYFLPQQKIQTPPCRMARLG